MNTHQTLLKKTCSLVLTLLFTFLSDAALAAENITFQHGYGRTHWGMSQKELMSAYEIKLVKPTSRDASGYWAMEGPADGELTVSGDMLKEDDIRSISFGVHEKFGLAITHIRFKNMNSPNFLDTLLPKWTANLGKPDQQLPGPKVIWEKDGTHVELTYHTVSPRHPTPSDHMAIVLWNIPLMDKIDAEGPDKLILPDVETLRPMLRHKSK